MFTPDEEMLVMDKTRKALHRLKGKSLEHFIADMSARHEIIHKRIYDELQDLSRLVMRMTDTLEELD